MKTALLLTLPVMLAASVVSSRADWKTYDSINEANARAAWAKSAMPMYEFLNTERSLVGKSVQVRGAGECLSETYCYLRDPFNPMQRVPIDPDTLDRADFRKFMECHEQGKTCEATIIARVGTDTFGEVRLTGVRAKW